MSRITRIILLPLLLASILALFSATGCATTGNTPAGTETTTAATQGEMSQQELQKILADSMTNFENVNTYMFDLVMDISMNVTGGTQPGTAVIKTISSGGMNTATNEMQMKMFMSLTSDILGINNESQNVSFDMYLLKDWAYVRTEIPGIGEQWTKKMITSSLDESFNVDVVEKQMVMLDSPSKIEYLRSEKVDGVDCYVLSITPDMNELTQWLNEQQAGDLNWDEMTDYSNIFKSFSILCYIAEESNLLMRMAVEMLMEYTSVQAGSSAEDFDKMTMNITMDMNVYDQNQPFSITLPDDAGNAIETSENMTSQTR